MESSTTIDNPKNLEKKPTVSVVIPCYNQGRFLADAVNSILRQTYPSYEIIIVNDGSTDETAAVSKEFGNSIRYIYQSNKGLSGARNAGFYASRGQFILFLDADDWVSSNYLEFQIKASLRFPQASVFLSDVATIKNAPGVGLDSSLDVHQIDYPDEPVNPIDRMFLGSPPFIHSAIVRRSLIDCIGVFDENLRSSEDSDFWIRAVLAGMQFVRSGGGVAVYRRSPGTLTSNLISLHRSRIKLIQKLYKDKIIFEKRLINLVDRRLVLARCALWNSTLSFHTSLSPTSIVKFTYHLIRFTLVDIGFIRFLFTYRPWKQRNN